MSPANLIIFGPIPSKPVALDASKNEYTTKPDQLL